MAKYRAAIVGLGGMGIGALPAAPHHTGMGIEWDYDSVAASLSHSSGFAVTPGVEVVAVCDLKEELFAAVSSRTMDGSGPTRSSTPTSTRCWRRKASTCWGW